MRPKKHETTGSGDLFRARLEQIINMKHELVVSALLAPLICGLDVLTDAPVCEAPERLKQRAAVVGARRTRPMAGARRGDCSARD